MNANTIKSKVMLLSMMILALILEIGERAVATNHGSLPPCEIATISITGPTEGMTGNAVSLAASVSQVVPAGWSNCKQVNFDYRWEFSSAPAGASGWSSMGSAASFVPQIPGSYVVRLSALQGSGQQKVLVGSAEKTIRITSTQSQTPACSSEFSTSTLDAGFTTYIPKSGPTFSLSAHSGFLRFNLPGTTTYDQWTNLDEAPQLRCPAPSGDWVVSTRLKLIAPTANGVNYHTGLLVVFSQFDILTWGIYQGNEIRLERTGVRPSISRPLASPNDELELQIEKRGTSYTLRERQAGSSSWTEVGKYEAKESPQFVGLVAKTWSALALTADFDYLTVGRP